MFNPWKEMDIINDPRGSLQNIILVTRKKGERERERERENRRQCSRPIKTLKLEWTPLIINTLKYYT